MGSSKMESGNIMNSEREPLPAAAGKVAGRARRRVAWGLALAAALAAAWPMGALAQTFNPPSGQTVSVAEGTLDMDGTLTAATVTLPSATVTYAAGRISGSQTFRRRWYQITPAAFEAADGGVCRSTTNRLSSSDPGYVALSGSSPPDITLASEMAGSLGAPSFTAPDVDRPTTLYFASSHTVFLTVDAGNICYYVAVTINDVEPPTITGLADASYFEGEEIPDAAFSATVSDPDNGLVLSIVTLTSTTGPAFTLPWRVTFKADGTDGDDSHQSRSFTVPTWHQDYTLAYTVTAYDEQGLTDTDTFTVSVAASTPPPTTPPPPPPNQPPVANAGPDQSVDEDELSVRVVTLDGTGSSDPEGDRLSYRWTQTGGPDVPFLGGLGIPRPSFRLTRLTADATLVFSLVVTDQFGNVSAADTVTVNIMADDDLPVVDAGDGQRVDQGLRVTLFGRASDEAGPPGIEWTQTAGPTVALSGATTLRPRFIAPFVQSDTTLSFRLRATEAGGAGRSVEDTVDVLVAVDTPPPLPTPEVYVVDGGDDITVAGGAEVTLHGTGYIRGTPVVGCGGNNWSWVQASGTSVTLSGDVRIVITSARGLEIVVSDGHNDEYTDDGQFRTTYNRQASFTAPTPTTTETLVFRFRGERPDVLFGSCPQYGAQEVSDYVTVTVTGSDTTTTQPVANAGPDQTVAAGAGTVTLSGSTTFSSPSYQWWQASGPAVTLSDSTAASPTFTAPSSLSLTETLVFQLVVTSGGFASAPDSVSVTVTTTNGAPDVDAGADATVLEGATVTLRGGGTDPDSDTLTYRWTQYGGPTVTLSDAAAQQPTFAAPSDVAVVTHLYFQVVGSDQHGASDRDEVVIQVDGMNDPPTVSVTADPNPAVEGASVTMTAVFSDTESAVSLEWEQDTAPADSGPEIPLLDARLPRHTFTVPNLLQSYRLYFTVTATDLHGATASDSVTISVTADNDRPIVLVEPANQTVARGTVRVTLDGSGSHDPEGGVLRYDAWQQVTRMEAPPQPDPVTGVPTPGAVSYAPIARDHPDAVTLRGGSTTRIVFDAPNDIARDADLFFRLTATDPQGLIGETVAGVQVRAMPVADAGEDQIAFEGAALVTLDGSGSSESGDPSDDGATLAYAWTQLSGPAVTLSDRAAQSPSFTAPDVDAETVLTFRLTATDRLGRRASDTVQVTVQVRLTVAAGAGATVDEGALVVLSGVVSDPATLTLSANTIPFRVEDRSGVDLDPATLTYVPATLAYRWEQIGGPAVVGLSGETSAAYSFTAPTPLSADADISFRLTVTAAGGAVSASDTVRVSVTAAGAGARPTADAGSDQTAAEGAQVTLSGTGSASGGGTLFYRWRQTGGPTVRLAAANAATATFTAPSQLSADAALRFGLTVTERVTGVDRALSSQADEALVTVTAGDNDAPTANAGPDQTVTEGATVTLDGSGSSDPEGEALSYAWTQTGLGGLAAVTLTGAAAARPTFVAPSLEVDTILSFSLAVRDARGLSGAAADTVRIRVQAYNAAPVANAGPDQTVTEGTEVTLDGTGSSDPEGQPLGYAWTQTGGPTVALGLQALEATPVFTAPSLNGGAAMDMAFQLNVVDSGGAASAAPDTVTVTVTPPSTDATLSGLALSASNVPVALSPAFASGTTSYTATVGNSVSTVDVTAAPADIGTRRDSMGMLIDGASVAIAGTAADGSTALTVSNAATVSGLTAGANVVTITVTAEDGSTTATYTLTVTVAATTGMADATLSALSLSEGTLSPDFASMTFSYTATVANRVATLTMATTANNGGASVALSGTDAGGGALTADSATMTFAGLTVFSGLTVGANTLTATVTAADTTTMQAYTVTVTRAAASADATLSGLSLSEGMLSPAFASATTAYSVSVGNAVTGIEVTATANDAGASLTFTGTAADGSTELTLAGVDPNAVNVNVVGADIVRTVASGLPVRISDLSVGANRIVFTVTAEDGSTTATYTLTVTRAALAIALSAPVPAAVAEGATLSFELSIGADAPVSDGTVSAVWRFSGSGANMASAQDFGDGSSGTYPTGTATIPNGQRSVTVMVATYDDALQEAAEGYAIALSSPGGGSVLGAPAMATGTIQASDMPAAFSISGAPSAAEGGALRFPVVGAGDMPSGDVEATCTVSGAGVTVGDFRDSAAATMASATFPATTLTFTAANYMRSQDCVIYSYDDADEEASETFTVTLTVSGGGAVVGGAGMGTATGTIQASDQPAGPQAAERTVRMEQAATALNRATAALSLPVIARRLDPGRGLASPGLALNLDGRQVLSSSSGAGAASASGGASGAPAIGLPQGLGGAASTPSTASTTSTASTMSTPSTATAATATGGPSQPGASSLNLSALAELAAAQLQGLDSGASGAESRPLRQLLGRSGFSATSEQGGGSTLSLWGRGNYTSLEGEPREGGTTYDYDGDSYGFYLGLDGRYGDYLAGVALGYTTGDVSLHAVSGPAVGAAGDRSDFESDLVTVYPYAAWQPSDRLSVWLLAGYGQGELEIEERRAGMPTLKASSDTDLLLGAAGLSWRRPADNNVDVLLRLSGTALHGETDGGRFDDADGTAYAKTKTDAQQLRGEAELGQVLDFDDGARLRPYLAVGASYDFGDGARDTMTGEFGTGFQLHWPRLGLETEWEVQARLASKSKRSYREYTGTGMLRYDLGGDRRGLQLALRPSLGLARDGLGASGASGVALDGGAFGGAGLPGAVGGGAVPGKGLGLRSELAYGIGGARLARGLPGLLTLYGESGLVSGASSYGGGLRFEAERLLLDAGLQRDSGADSDSAFLLDATLRF